MEDFFARINHAGLTDTAIDWGGMWVSEVFPARVPSLFVGRPVIRRFSGDANVTVRVTGNVAGERFGFPVPTDAESASSNHETLPSVWARMKSGALAVAATWPIRNKSRH